MGMKHTLTDIERETRLLRMLYVEDNEDARTATLLVLNEFFSDITIATNGQAGLEACEAQHFDLIITDINMPVMNGIEMLNLLRRRHIHTPALVLSAYSDQGYFADSIKAGVDGYLLKPIEMDQFIDIMQRVTEKIRLERENEAYKNRLESMVAEQTAEIKAKAQRLYQQSITDSLTGLYNATMLHRVLQKSRYNYLMVLDLVNFSVINKQYGKNFGNAILKATAQTLQRLMKENMRLFKVESDCFAIVLHLENQEAFGDMARQIIAFFDTGVLNVQGSAIGVNFTIGGTHIVPEGNALLEADFAMDWAKKQGRRSYCLYEENSELMQREQETISWLSRTKVLIEEGSIEPYFQPIFDVKTQKIVRYEVLARAIENNQVILPFYFLPAAERLGLISAITRMIVNKSFAFFAAQTSTYDFSINVSERDLLEGEFTKFMLEKSQRFGIDPSRVTFEILEGITMANQHEKIMDELEQLRKAGFKLAVDDFGVENSNFARLLDIELDFIKIDGVFVRNILNNTKDKKIITAIVSLARTLGIKTVAEFVENEAIYAEVIHCGVDYVQGYHIGRPDKVLLEL